MTSRPSRAAGFTIIETLIVLAIAGFMLTIIFLAIPALGRSGRNNQRRQDVQTVLQAVSHYELAHSDSFPPDANSLTNYGLTSNRLSYYDLSVLGSITVQPEGPGVPLGLANHNPNNNLDSLYVYNHQLCDPAYAGASTYQGAGYNDVVALYAIETGGGTISQCQQL